MKNLLYISVAIAAVLGSVSLAPAQGRSDRLWSRAYANDYNRVIVHPGRSMHSGSAANDVYGAGGQYIGSDPDAAVRREIVRAPVGE
jgi:hypothetical protein